MQFQLAKKLNFQEHCWWSVADPAGKAGLRNKEKEKNWDKPVNKTRNNCCNLQKFNYNSRLINITAETTLRKLSQTER